MHKSSKYEHKMKILYCISYYKEQEVLILFFIFWHCLILCNEQIFGNLSLWQMRYFLIQNWLSKESQICGYNAIRNNGQSQLYLICIKCVYTAKTKCWVGNYNCGWHCSIGWQGDLSIKQCAICNTFSFPYVSLIMWTFNHSILNKEALHLSHA